MTTDGTITDTAAAKADFDKGAYVNAFTFTEGLTPVKAYAVDSHGALSNIYWAEAWNADSDVNYDNWKTEWLGGKKLNFDKVAPALFIYVGEPFDDPGVSDIHNNAGDLIRDTVVERSLTYYTLTGTDYLGFNGTERQTVQLASYTVGGSDADAGNIPLQRLELKGIVDGEEEAEVTGIRPGVYQLIYTFLDYDGVTPVTIARPLIVLYRNGDVNADRGTTGTAHVTEADATAIQERFVDDVTKKLPLEAPNYSTLVDMLVYRYRILDANNDRNINNIDSNLIREVLDTTSAINALTEFYLPTDYITPANDAGAGETP